MSDKERMSTISSMRIIYVLLRRYPLVIRRVNPVKYCEIYLPPRTMFQDGRKTYIIVSYMKFKTEII